MIFSAAVFFLGTGVQAHHSRMKPNLGSFSEEMEYALNKMIFVLLLITLV